MGGAKSLATIAFARSLSSGRGLTVRDDGGVPGFTYTWPADSTTVAANPTDVFALAGQYYSRVAYVQAVTVWAKADTNAIVDFLIQRSANGGGGTFTNSSGNIGRSDVRSRSPNFASYRFTVNRSSGGNGVSGTRTVHGGGSLICNGDPIRVEFASPIALRDLTEWLVVNLGGAAMPTNFKIGCTMEWTEEAVSQVMFAGDSTTSNANFMFDALYLSGALQQAASPFNAGSNGFRLQDALLNTNSIPFPLVGGNGIIERLGDTPGVLVLCYGLNDLRQGAVTRNELISMIDAAIYATLNGTTSGATYTSPLGAGTTFTWPATIAAKPDTRIILWSPNSLTTDGNGSSFVTLTGRFAAMTLAEAAQTITDDLYFAYEAFRNDPRVWRVVHKQDVFGRTSTTVADSGIYAQSQGHTATTAPLMTDILHPNARGQVLSARQIVPPILDALNDLRIDISFGL